MAGGSGAGVAASKQSGIDRNATVRVAIFNAIGTTIDPHKAYFFAYSKPVYDRLTQYDPLFKKVRPMLATSWSFTPNGRILYLNLRRGVRFHDGTPVNAAAVVASINRGKTVPGTQVATYLGSIRSLAAAGPYRVRVNLVPGRGAELPSVFASNAGTVINPKFLGVSDLDRVPPVGAGSGPYVVTDVSATRVRYRRASGKPWEAAAGRAGFLEITQISTGAQGLDGLRTGDFDVVQTTTDTLVEMANLVRSSSGRLRGKKFVGATLRQITFNPKVAPFNDVRLRRAVQAAIDKNAYNNGLRSGNCPTLDQPVPKGYWAYSPTFKTSNPYNLTRSRALLAAAGRPNGFSFELQAGNFSTFPSEAQVFQNFLERVGIDVRINLLSSQQFRANFNAGQFAASTATGLAVAPDPDAVIVQSTLLGGSSLVVGTPYEARVRTLGLAALKPGLTLEQRGRIYGQLWKYMDDNALSITVCAGGYMWARTSNAIIAKPGDNPDIPIDSLPGSLDPRYFAKTR